MPRIRSLVPPIAGTLLTMAFELSVAAGWFTQTPDVLLWALWIIPLGLWAYWIATHKHAAKLYQWLAKERSMLASLFHFLWIGALIGMGGSLCLFVLVQASRRNAPERRSPSSTITAAQEPEATGKIQAQQEPEQPHYPTASEIAKELQNLQHAEQTHEERNPELHTLAEAKTVLESLTRFWNDWQAKQREEDKRIDERNGMKDEAGNPKWDAENQARYRMWRYTELSNKEVLVYKQLYADRINRLRLEMLNKVPEAADAMDYDREPNGGFILGVTINFPKIIDAYEKQLRAEGQIKSGCFFTSEETISQSTAPGITSATRVLITCPHRVEAPLEAIIEFDQPAVRDIGIWRIIGIDAVTGDAQIDGSRVIVRLSHPPLPANMQLEVVVDSIVPIRVIKASVHSIEAQRTGS